MAMTQATSEFDITGWEDAAYPDQGDGSKLSRATVKKRFRGEIEGISTAEVLLYEGDGGTGA